MTVSMRDQDAAVRFARDVNIEICSKSKYDMTIVVGIDGCNSGWLCLIKDLTLAIGEARILKRITELSDLSPKPAVVAIDIPIGLVDHGKREVAAFEILCDPLGNKPIPKRISPLSYQFWGVPRLVQRLIFGADDYLLDAILKSGKWAGTPKDLKALIKQQTLGHHILPIRDAVDFIHTCVYSTIKAMKFSSLFQICGGPIELAVITADRRFRWVRHKAWDSAIQEG